MRAHLLSQVRRALGRPGPARPVRRAIGMDDWQGSIGTADPDRLWPVPPADGAGPPDGRRPWRRRSPRAG